MSKDKIKNFSNFSLGFSMVEMLVVVAIFSILAVLATQSIATSLRGSKKSSNAVTVRQGLDYVTSVMDRQLRNAQGLVLPTPCNPAGVNSMEVDYLDENNQSQSFTCNGSGSVGYVTSSVFGRLTPPEINITSCPSAFACDLGTTSGQPPSVTLNLTGTNTNALGADATQISTTARILLRSYSSY